MRAAALFVLPAILLSGCGKPADAPAPKDAPAAETVALAPTPYAGGPLAVGAGGVGPVTAQTAFDKTAIEALFPGLTVETGFLQFGEHTTPIITVRNPETQLVQIEQGTGGLIGRVRVQGGDARGPNGETLLQTWPDASFQVSDCAMGEGSDRAALVCRKPSAANVAMVFGVRGWTRDAVPPADVLAAKAFVREMVWTPA